MNQAKKAQQLPTKTQFSADELKVVTGGLDHQAVLRPTQPKSGRDVVRAL